MHPYPPRPSWNHTEVKTEATRRIVDDVFAWAIGMGVLSEESPKQELQAVLTLAVLESADAYEAGRYIETFLDWPTNGDLVRLIDRAYLTMPNLTGPFIHAWVMEHNVRFNAKDGDTLVVTVGGVEIRGTCVGVIPREARGFMEIAGTKRGQVISVNAEDVIKVTKAKPTTGRTTPPTGGTPIAPRAGAILKKAAA